MIGTAHSHKSNAKVHVRRETCRS